MISREWQKGFGAQLIRANYPSVFLSAADPELEDVACNKAPKTEGGCVFACEWDGIHYKPTQCCNDACWCVDPVTGKEVDGVIAESGKLGCPVSPGKNCLKIFPLTLDNNDLNQLIRKRCACLLALLFCKKSDIAQLIENLLRKFKF